MVKQGYHHGNLRQALVESAIKLIEARGPTGFSLSEAAKQAGVTPAAVYRHFEGRDDLIAEVALEGYKIFADLMQFAYDKANLLLWPHLKPQGELILRLRGVTQGITFQCLRAVFR